MSVKIVVIGAGPGGMSAAARAAESDTSHILLESSRKVANTIQKYQKGKHVMADPGILPLRSPVGFEAGKREDILDVWEAGLAKHSVSIQYSAEASAIEGEKGNFTIRLTNGETVQGEKSSGTIA